MQAQAAGDYIEVTFQTADQTKGLLNDGEEPSPQVTVEVNETTIANGLANKVGQKPNMSFFYPDPEDGFEFAGWRVAGTEELLDMDAYVLPDQASVTLEAVFTDETPTPPTPPTTTEGFSVYFTDNAGAAIAAATQQVNKNDNADLDLAAGKYAGNKCLAWYDTKAKRDADATNLSEWLANTTDNPQPRTVGNFTPTGNITTLKVTGETTVYGLWTVATYTFKYGENAIGSFGYHEMKKDAQGQPTTEAKSVTLPEATFTPANGDGPGQLVVSYTNGAEGLDGTEWVPGEKVLSTDSRLDKVDGTVGQIVLTDVTEDAYELTVNYNGHGNGSKPNVDHIYALAGDTFDEPEVTEPTGYKFGGWFADSDLTEEFDFDAVPTASGEVYAKWTEDKVTFSFVVEGTATQKQFKMNSEVTLADFPQIPAKEGYDAHWSASAQCSKVIEDDEYADAVKSDDKIKAIGPKTFYAHYTPKTYAVEYYSNDGATKYTGLDNGTSFTWDADPAPLSDGKASGTMITNGKLTLMGWTDVKGSSEVKYDLGQKVKNLTTNKKIKMYGVWKNAITVTFTVDENDDAYFGKKTDENNKQKVEHFVIDSTTKMPGAVELGLTPKTGYALAGWEQTNPTATDPADPTKPKTWAVGDQLYDPEYTATTEITVKALWAGNAHTVKFDANGGEGSFVDQNIVSGSKVKDENGEMVLVKVVFPNAGTFTKEGCTFKEWNTKADGKGATAPDTVTSDMVTEDITYYAIYEPKDLSVSFSDNIGTVEHPINTWAGVAGATRPATVNFKYGADKQVTVPDLYLADDYGTQQALYKYEDTVDGKTVVVVGTLAGTWSDKDGKTYNPGDKIATKDLKKSLELTPTFNVQAFTVTYVDEDGETVLDTQTVLYGAEPQYKYVAGLTYDFTDVVPTKADADGKTFKFAGWTTVKGSNVATYPATWNVGTGKCSCPVAPAKNDATYYAVYTDADALYGFYFDYNEVTPTNPVDTTGYRGLLKDATVEKPADPVAKDYTFIDWYEVTTDDHNVETVADEPYDWTQPVSKDVYLQAKWAGKNGVVEIPEVSLVYNGKEQTGLTDTDAYKVMSYDADYDIEQGVYASKATDAGSYGCYLVANKGYSWSDGSVGGQAVEWTITRAPVDVPAAKTLKYTGQQLVAYSAAVEYDMNGTSQATEPGKYELKLTPTKNYMWADGTTEAKIIEWSIVKEADVEAADKAVKDAEALLADKDSGLTDAQKADLQKAIDAYKATDPKTDEAAQAMVDAYNTAKKASDAAKKGETDKEAADKAAVDKAKADYDALTADQKALVPAAAVQKLDAAVKAVSTTVTVTVKNKKVKVKAKNLKKKAVTIKASKVTKGNSASDGSALTYSKVKVNKKAKKFTVNSDGSIKVAKKVKKGTYKVTVNAASGAVSQDFVVTIKVK